MVESIDTRNNLNKNNFKDLDICYNTEVFTIFFQVMNENFLLICNISIHNNEIPMPNIIMTSKNSIKSLLACYLLVFICYCNR